MALRLGTTVRNLVAAAIGSSVDAGSGAGTIKHYTGAQPAAVSDNPSGTLLGTNTFSDPAFGSPATGVITADAIANDTNADASGTAGHFVLSDSDGNPLMDGDSGMGSGTCSWDNNVVVASGVIAISAATITVPIS